MTGVMESRPHFFYKAFGLSLRSDVALPAFVDSRSRNAKLAIEWTDRIPDSHVPASDQLLYASEYCANGRLPFFSVSRRSGPSSFCLRCRHSGERGDATFDINSGGAKIVVASSTCLERADVMSYLIGPVMGCALRVRGTLNLHAAVVNFHDRALAIIGPKGSGKSTLAAAFAERGYPILTDDIAVISEEEEGFTIAPSYGCLRVWPNAHEHVSGLHTDSLPRVLSGIDKRFQPLTTNSAACKWRFSEKPAPLAAIYVLSRSSSYQTRFRSLSFQEGIITLMSNVYASYISDAALRAHDFKALARLTSYMLPLVAESHDGDNGFRERFEGILNHASERLNVPHAART
jgi:hypothetical protein